MHPLDDSPPESREPTPPSSRQASESPELRKGQFDLVSILSWTTVIAAHAVIAAPTLRELTPDSVLPLTLFWLIFLLPATTCIPMLISRWRSKGKLHFGRGESFRLIVFLTVFGAAMIVVATMSFTAEWKSRGFHWSYYMLDGWAGVTLWPIYAIATGIITHGILGRKSKAARLTTFPVYAIASLTLSAICFWYTIATLFFGFADGEPQFAMVPGSVGVCYFLLAVTILKKREYPLTDFAKPKLLLPWLLGILASILAKIPTAMRLYEQLPDEAPGCFVVSAACQGHRQFVRSKFDSQRNRWVNQQLLTFWELEDWLVQHAPRFQRRLRRIYNVIGPIVARRILFRWQADCVYLLLKPLEMTAQMIMQRSRQVPRK